MNNLILITILLISIQVSSFGQGMTKFEIWGWNGTKEEFAQKYLNQTGKDINKTYCCAAELKKMGYVDASSNIFVNDIKEYLSGKTNWNLTERVVTLREATETKFSEIISDSLWQVNTIKSIEEFKEKDSTYIQQYLSTNDELVYNVLLGTICSKNDKLRADCCDILNTVNVSTKKFSKKEHQLLAIMLSFPSPSTCYAAMKVILTLDNVRKMSTHILKNNHQTMNDFLQSELQSYRVDAIKFLCVVYPEKKKNNLTWSEWYDWLNK